MMCNDSFESTQVYVVSCMDKEIAELKDVGINVGDISDGYHTFNELYYHRMILTSVIVNMLAKEHPDMVWKSKQHHDPNDPMYDGMFIVGINCPDGQASYHYDLPDWDRFQCQELDRAPEFDGHTPDEAIERISKITF